MPRSRRRVFTVKSLMTLGQEIVRDVVARSGNGRLFTYAAFCRHLVCCDFDSHISPDLTADNDNTFGKILLHMGLEWSILITGGARWRIKAKVDFVENQYFAFAKRLLDLE